MRIRIDEAIEHFNATHPEAKLNKRRLAQIAMPDTEITAAQLYLIKLNKGNFGTKKSVNMDVIDRIMKHTGLTSEFLFDFET
jgi:hypothetical protein